MIMAGERRVQVVLGEAEPTDGFLRFVLEGEGFDIIGMASSDEELARVLKGARPSVIVLDGGISATAALEARASASGARLVVVWPDGVAAVIAEERVDPHLVVDELGDAVRRASCAIRIRDATEDLPLVEERRAPRPVRPLTTLSHPDEDHRDRVRARRSRRGVLVAVGTWALVLMTLTTIAVAVPNAFEHSSHDMGRSPSRSPIAPKPSSALRGVVDVAPGAGGRNAESSAGARCEPKQGRTDREESATRSADDHSAACRQDGAHSDARAKDHQAGGRPADPGQQSDAAKSQQTDRTGAGDGAGAAHEQEHQTGNRGEQGHIRRPP